MIVVHTESSDGWGGQEIRILQESIALTGSGHEVSFILQRGGRLEEECREAGFSFLSLDMRGALDIPSFLAARGALRRRGPDVVHCHSSKDHWICGAAAKSLGIPVVRSRHISVPLKRRFTTRFLYCRLADRVIASGAVIRDMVVGAVGCGPGHVVSVPAGVDLALFDPSRVGDPSRLRREIGIPESAPVVGCVGVLRSWKGQHVLIDAVPALRAAFPDLRALLVGDGPQRENLVRRVKDLGLEDVVTFTGHRRDVPDLVLLMDVVVLPSIRAEATSQVIPQAWAMGRPVVATAVGGLPEIVEEGVDGILVPPDRPLEIANAVVRLLKDRGLRDAMASRGNAKARSVYSFAVQMRKTMEVYAQLITAGGRSRGKRERGA